MNHSIHLVFLNWEFGLGGAERQLIELLKHIDKRQFRVSVVTCYDHGLLQPKAEAIEGIYPINLGKKWAIRRHHLSVAAVACHSGHSP